MGKNYSKFTPRDVLPSQQQPSPAAALSGLPHLDECLIFRFWVMPDQNKQNNSKVLSEKEEEMEGTKYLIRP